MSKNTNQKPVAQFRTLTDRELQETDGGVLGLVMGAAIIGSVAYATYKNSQEYEKLQKGK